MGIAGNDSHQMTMLNMKSNALLVLLMTVSAAVLAQNAPAPAPAAAAASTTAKPVEAAKPAVTAKPVEAAKAAAAPAAPAATKPVADSAKAPPKEIAKEPAAEPVAATTKPADKNKPVIAEVKKPLTTPPCPIAEFRAIGMETGDAVERRAKALDWLAKKGKQCSPEKLVAIRNNRPQWMGHADSTVVAAAVDTLLESSIEGNPAVLNLLYGTQPPPPKPPEEKKPAK